MSFLSYESVIDEALAELPDSAEDAVVVFDDRIRARLSELRSDLRARFFGRKKDFHRLYRRHMEAIYQFAQEASLDIDVPNPDVDVSSRTFPSYYQSFLDRMDQVKLSIRIRSLRQSNFNAQGGVPLDTPAQAKVLNHLAELRPLIRTIGMKPADARTVIDRLHRFSEQVDRDRTKTDEFFTLWMEFTAFSPESGDSVRKGMAELQGIARTLHRAQLDYEASGGDTGPLGPGRKKDEDTADGPKLLENSTKRFTA